MDSYSFWIIITAALAASSCALLGSFLVLRKNALLGDAISHAVLPGIVISFLLTGSRSTIPMLIGASVMGLLAVVFIAYLQNKWRVQEDASIGIVFTALFAIGVVLISAFAGHVELDQECVLYGEIAYTPWNLLIVGGTELGPKPVWILGAVLLLNLLLILLFYKELLISSFDPGMATSLGISASLLHYILMGAVSLTTVASFESVGAILVLAMLIVPGATAYLLTDRLAIMLVLAVFFGVLSAIFGYGLAVLWDSSIAGAITIASGGMFAMAMLFSPQHGVVGRALNQFNLGVHFAVDHQLLRLLRAWEAGEIAVTPEQLLSESSTSRLQAWLGMRRSKKMGLLSWSDDQVALTGTGQLAAKKLIQGHRLWEAFLSQKAGLPSDHTHDPAHRMEHFIDDHLKDRIRDEIGDIQTDPQGKQIP